jgi:hypothetical protein
MTFLANPLGFSPSEFKTYVEKLTWTGWRPKYLVLHNTAAPNLRQWTHGNAGKDYEHQRVLNLNHYYKSEKGWHSGPHLFISPSLIWVACDLTADGVHASCYNRESLGVEMVGDYGVEDFASGDGAKVRDNAVAALAILHHTLGISPDTLHFHKECLRDHHDCPGKNVTKSDIIARIKAWSKDGSPAAPVAAGGGSSGSAGARASCAETEKAAPVALGGSEAAAYTDKAALIYKFWLAGGFTPAQACGLLAQAEAESALDPKAVDAHGQAFGLDQWRAPRVDAIRTGCGVDLRTLPPLEEQLKAALWELQHTEKHALNQIKATKTAFDAGYAAARFWERPAHVAQYAKRGAAAEKWAAYFAKHPV